MAEFPIIEARQELGFDTSTAVRANIDVRGTGGTGAAVGQAVLAGVELGIEYDLKQVNNQLSESQRLAEDEINRMKINLAGNLDPDTHQQEFDAAMETIQGFAPKRSRGAQAYKLWLNKRVPKWQDGVSRGRIARSDDNWLAEATLKIASIESDPTKFADFERFLARRQVFDPIDKTDAVRLLATAKKAHSFGSVENIKPLMVIAIKANGKQAGLEVLNESLKKLVSDGVLTAAEGAQTDKILGDWVDNFVAGRISQAGNAAKLTTQQSYLELTEKILDRGDGKLNFNDIEQSKLLKADKDKWQAYIKGSYKEPPTENTPTGLDNAFTAVFNAATLQQSPQEAMDGLLEARFVKSSITEEQFEWGMNKIQNPYPKKVLHDLQAVLKSNNDDFNRWLRFDKERNKTVNELLIDWVDNFLEQDKLIPFDFRKQMVAQSSQFRVGDDRWYDIGQVIELGGREWEVVGFDETGEPLMEEVE